MAHRAKLYRVEIHGLRNRSDRRLLGSIDGHGLEATEIVRHVLLNLNATNLQGTIAIAFEQEMHPTRRDEVGATVFRGSSGISSAIQLFGSTVFQRQQNHTEAVRAGVLFSLPRASFLGTVALHVPHNMGYKSLLEEQLRATFRSLSLSISLLPIVPIEAFRQAVLDGHVKKLTLIRHSIADEDPYRHYARLGRSDFKRMTLVLEARRNRFLRVDSLERFVEFGDRHHLREVLEFGELPFDEATVAVQLPNGTTRTFDLEGAEGGHPMSVLLGVRDTDDDEPETNFGAPASDLARELEKAIDIVSTEGDSWNAGLESSDRVS